MDPEFPSIWLDLKVQGCQKILIGGFYRVWTHEGKNGIKDQEERMDQFVKQITAASKLTKQVIILGDANLYTKKWNSSNFKYKGVADRLKEALDLNGL